MFNYFDNFYQVTSLHMWEKQRIYRKFI